MKRFLLSLAMCLVCSAAGATTTVTKTFEYSGGDYAHLNDCVGYFASTYPTGFVASDINGVCTSSGAWASADTTAVNIAVGTTNATHTMTITTTGSARHDGRAAAISGRSNYRLSPTNSTAINISTGSYTPFYITIDGLEILGWNTSDTFHDAFYLNNISYYTLSNLIIHDATNRAYGIHTKDNNQSGSAKIFNTVIYNIGSADNLGVGIYNENYYAPNIYNATVYNIYGTAGSYGIGINVNDSTVKNTVSVGNRIDFAFSSVTSAYNMSTDATATGTGSLTGNTAANQFVSVGSGTENFNLKAGSGAISAGTDLNATIGYPDIAGTTRSGAWDMGAFKYTSSGPASHTSVYRNSTLRNGVFR